MSLLKTYVTLFVRSTLKSLGYHKMSLWFDSHFFHSYHSLSQRQHLNTHYMLGIVDMVGSKTHIHPYSQSIFNSHYQVLTLS